MAKNLNLFQNLGTLLALVISVSALFVSIYEANLMKAQQKAMVWPHLVVDKMYNSDGFSFIARNNGIGPALVKSIEYRYDGEPKRNYSELMKAINPNFSLDYGVIKIGVLHNTVMKAGEERLLFNMPWTDETRELSKYMNNVIVKVNYCSVLEDCWIFDSTKKEHTPGRFEAALEFNQ